MLTYRTNVQRRHETLLVVVGRRQSDGALVDAIVLGTAEIAHHNLILGRPSNSVVEGDQPPIVIPIGVQQKV